MKIAIATDAWRPQVNGVAKTLETTVNLLEALGYRVVVIEPAQFAGIPCPTYPEIKLAWRPFRRVAERLSQFDPDSVHIATEGPIGLAVRNWCLRNGLPFTTSYHTQFPEYLRARLPLPLSISYRWLRQFHGAAARTMVATASLQTQLQRRGFRNLVRWSRGVDIDLFKPYGREFLPYPRPIMLYAGRVAVEKNLEEFLRLDVPGTKVIVGDGPAVDTLRNKYPQARLVGYRFGVDLAQHIASADVFVFPSRTDTFGLVLLEAMACGVPVAAYPVMGPVDVVAHGVSGILDWDLANAIRQALRLDPAQCRQHAVQFSWEAATHQFIDNLCPIDRTVSVRR